MRFANLAGGFGGAGFIFLVILRNSLFIGEVGVYSTVTISEDIFAFFGNSETSVVIVANPDFSYFLACDVAAVQQKSGFAMLFTYLDLTAMHYQPPAFAAIARLTCFGG